MPSVVIFKLRDPDTNKVCLIGITDRSANETIEAIMRKGSITKKADQIIKRWIKKGKSPVIQLSKSNVGKNSTPTAIRSLAAIMEAVALEETLITEEEMVEILKRAKEEEEKEAKRVTPDKNKKHKTLKQLAALHFQFNTPVGREIEKMVIAEAKTAASESQEKNV